MRHDPKQRGELDDGETYGVELARFRHYVKGTAANNSRNSIVRRAAPVSALDGEHPESKHRRREVEVPIEIWSEKAVSQIPESAQGPPGFWTC